MASSLTRLSLFLKMDCAGVEFYKSSSYKATKTKKTSQFNIPLPFIANLPPRGYFSP